MRTGCLGACLVVTLPLSCGGNGEGSGSATDGPACTEGAPNRPSLLAPSPGDVFPEALRLAGSTFSDVDGDTHVASEYEIRFMSGGQASALAWAASVTESDQLREVRLVDGEFVIGDGLNDRTTYGARVRYGDSGEGCTWSEWSQWREFSTDERLYLFDPEVIHTFEIEIPPESWDPIHNEAEAPGCEQYQRNYYSGNLRFQGQQFEGVGIRAKGGCGSSRDLNNKAAFKVNLEWDDPAVPGCGPSRSLFGLNTITLNNGIQDPSAMHERMAYRLLRAAGVPAPRAVNARVVVNDEYWGLYVHVETIDRTFLKRWFTDPKGMMYEGAYWCDLVEENLPATDDGPTCFQREFRPDECDGPLGTDVDPKDWELLRTLIQDLARLPPNELYPAVGSVLDFDTFITMMAAEGVLAHWDGYPWELNNNYRVYHDPVLDDWTVLPWGIDQTFERNFDPWESARGVLSAACLDQAECEALYAGRLRDMTDLFEQMEFAAEVEVMRDQIRAHVEEDPRKEFGMQQWNNEVGTTLDFIGSRPDEVDAMLTARGY